MRYYRDTLYNISSALVLFSFLFFFAPSARALFVRVTRVVSRFQNGASLSGGENRSGDEGVRAARSLRRWNQGETFRMKLLRAPGRVMPGGTTHLYVTCLRTLSIPLAVEAALFPCGVHCSRRSPSARRRFLPAVLRPVTKERGRERKRVKKKDTIEKSERRRTAAADRISPKLSRVNE